LMLPSKIAASGSITLAVSTGLGRNAAVTRRASAIETLYRSATIDKLVSTPSATAESMVSGAAADCARTAVPAASAMAQIAVAHVHVRVPNMSVPRHEPTGPRHLCDVTAGGTTPPERVTALSQS